jgi:regulatory protein
MASPPDAYIAALRILHYRFNSEGELRRKLRAKKFEAEAIDAAIQRLYKEKWLDDQRFAGAFVRTKASKRLGRRRILRELENIGVSGEAAAQAIAENIDPERERDGLRELCARRARLLVRKHGPEFLATEEGRSKLTAYLLNHGYDMTMVNEALKELAAAAKA